MNLGPTIDLAFLVCLILAGWTVANTQRDGVDGETTFLFEVISADDNAGNNTTQGTVWTSEEVATNLEVLA